jgi:hypothetical protein
MKASVTMIMFVLAFIAIPGNPMYRRRPAPSPPTVRF